MTSFSTRRAWLTHTTAQAAALVAFAPRALQRPAPSRPHRSRNDRGHPYPAGDVDTSASLVSDSRQALALRAVDAARTAGASYADARLTRIVTHEYSLQSNCDLVKDDETVGVGVRVLVDGYWGFSASALWDPDEVVRLARDAVTQAQENTKGLPRTVDLGHIPVVTGTWSTPIKIDPFAIPIEEKLDICNYWKRCADRAGLPFYNDGLTSHMTFARQEQVLASSEGLLLTQTLFESGGGFQLGNGDLLLGADGPIVNVKYIETAGKGWEVFLEAKIPDQFPVLLEERNQKAQKAKNKKGAVVGRYTLVCDSQTIAALLASTLGIATQLDRALGYEANAGGTSFIDDPLGMAGHLQVASPLVTVKANRSAPAQLATVQWDAEGVVPPSTTLVHNGVLTDFQTTREQAAWLTPYYHAHGRPMASNGCAAAEDAHGITMQHMPNLALEPSATATRLDDLVADVADGIFVEHGGADCDFQGRNGVLQGAMTAIKNGRLSHQIVGGTVRFNTLDFWKRIQVLGGPSTQAVIGYSQYGGRGQDKGQPPQRVSHSAQAVAATITNQPIIDILRKA